MKYMPILTARQGELKALNSISPDDWSQTTPLLEVPTPSFTGTASEMATNIATSIKLDSTRPCRVDLSRLSQFPQSADGKTFACEVLERLIAQQGLFKNDHQISPVVYHDDILARLGETVELVQLAGNGACFRLTPTDLITVESLPDLIEPMKKLLKVPAEKIDILLDFGQIESIPASTILGARQLLKSFSNYADYRNVIIAAGSFPKDLSGIQQGIVFLSRPEWGFWEAVVGNAKGAISFGDYGCAHTEAIDVDFDGKVPNPSASIRYTVDEYWLIVKGISISKGGAEQYQSHCRELVARDEFCGRDFSAGDAYIDDCAQGKLTNAGKVMTGNAGTWVQVRTSHHVAFICSRLRQRG